MDNIGNRTLTINMGINDLKSLAGWATFNAVINIIVGAISCLGFILIVPVAYGILQIIAGVKLLSAAEDLKKHILTDDEQKITDALYNMNRFFKLNGISIIIKIGAVILLIILYSVLIALFFPYLKDFVQNSSYSL